MKKMLIAAITAIALVASLIGCQVYDSQTNETLYTAMNRSSATSWEDYAQSINDDCEICADAITKVSVKVVVTDVRKNTGETTTADLTDKSSGSHTKEYKWDLKEITVDKNMVDYLGDATVDALQDIMDPPEEVITAASLIHDVTPDSDIDSALESIIEEFLEYDDFYTLALKKAKSGVTDQYDVDEVKEYYINNASINAKGKLKAQIAYYKAHYLNDVSKIDESKDQEEEIEKIEGVSGYYIGRVQLEGVSIKDLWDKEYKLKWDYNNKK